jgi:hypothetical protein
MPKSAQTGNKRCKTGVIELMSSFRSCSLSEIYFPVSETINMKFESATSEHIHKDDVFFDIFQVGHTITPSP